MTKQKTVAAQRDSEKSARWQRPEVRRLEAGLAEGAAATGTDNLVYS